MNIECFSYLIFHENTVYQKMYFYFWSHNKKNPINISKSADLIAVSSLISKLIIVLYSRSLYWVNKHFECESWKKLSLNYSSNDRTKKIKTVLHRKLYVKYNNKKAHDICPKFGIYTLSMPCHLWVDKNKRH